jgi:uncharacterized protein (DUF2141 family)
MPVIAALVFAAQAAVAGGQAGAVEIDFEGLRNSRGTIRVCMTRDPAHFPDCSGDPAALTQSVSAVTRRIEFGSVPAGNYAIAVFHDENNNKKLDTFLGVPREGFGFSRNPTISFGAPHFDKVDIRIAPGMSRASVRLQYLL